MAIDKYLRIKQVCELTGLSRATIYAMEKSNNFPQKIALGERAVAWRESEIAAWMEARRTAVKSGREAKPGKPPVRKSSSGKGTEKSTAGLLSKDSSPLTDAPKIVSKPTDDFPDWSDAVDVPVSPNQGHRPSQPLKKLKVTKGNAGVTNRRGTATNLVAEFNTPGLSKPKPGE